MSTRLAELAPGTSFLLPVSGLRGTLIRVGIGGATVRFVGRGPELVSAGTVVEVLTEPADHDPIFD